jgi:hypothetical protein
MSFRNAESQDALIKTAFWKDELRESPTPKNGTRGTRPSEKGALWHEGCQ